MKDFAQSLLDLWKELGLNQRVSLIVAAVAVAGGLIGVALWSSRPDYQLLYARMSEKDATAVIGYLQGQNIPHQVSAGGTAVSVPTDQVYKLRMDLAAKGLPSGDGVGFEIFDKGQFGLSDFVQRTNYLRAVQGELSRTITQLAGVHAARVMIVQPENRLLLTEQGVKSTASVFVDLGGGRLEPDQVDSIRHLVANSVQGLAADDVAVVDNHGRVLSESLKQDPTLGAASSQIRYRQQVEDYFARKVESMLATVIGPGQAVVRVSADIDTDATTLQSDKYDPDGQVVRSQTDTEDISNSTEGHTTAAVGVSANVPGAPGTAPAADKNAPASTNEQNRKNRTTTYEINRVTTSTTRTPGAVKSLTASVLVAPRAAAAGAAAAPAKRTPEELAALRQVVINALGIKPAAGQNPESLVALQEVAFAAEPVSTSIQSIQQETRWQGWVEAGSRWAAVGGAALALFAFWRLLSRAKPEAVPVELLQLPADPGSPGRLSPGGQVTPELLNALIRQKPVNVSTTLREWAAPGAKN